MSVTMGEGIDRFSVTFSAGMERFVGRYPRLQGVCRAGEMLRFSLAD